MDCAPQVDDSLEDLYHEAPCGYVSTLPDGTLLRTNRTFLSWTGYSTQELFERRRFPALLTAPGAMLYETHCAPMLRLKGFVGEVSLDLLCSDGRPLPVLLSAVAKRGADGHPTLLRIIAYHAPTRREYERELLLARRQADAAAEQLRVQAEQLIEHSALLIPIQGDLRVMPLLGAIDAARGCQILRVLLRLESGSGVRTVILDLTGVPELDAAATATLRQAAAGLRLRGVWPILTGIRPAVAASLVTLDLSLAGFTVCGTLQDGVALANRGARGKR